jgi:hypothetical protein
MSKTIKNLITHSTDCNINGYGYCDCGADPNRYLNEKDVKDIVDSYKKVIVDLEAMIAMKKIIEKTGSNKTNKEWNGLTEFEVNQVFKDWLAYSEKNKTDNLRIFVLQIEAKLKEKNT